jgi:hypothetical protein
LCRPTFLDASDTIWKTLQRRSSCYFSSISELFDEYTFDDTTLPEIFCFGCAHNYSNSFNEREKYFFLDWPH